MYKRKCRSNYFEKKKQSLYLFVRDSKLYGEAKTKFERSTAVMSQVRDKVKKKKKKGDSYCVTALLRYRCAE